MLNKENMSKGVAAFRRSGPGKQQRPGPASFVCEHYGGVAYRPTHTTTTITIAI